jgi:signal transduction histidine kinase
MLRCIASCVLFIIAFSSYGKTDSPDYAVSHYTTESGLPQNSVKSIGIDELGFCWLATEMGLVRFDGRNFKLFNKRNTGTSSNRFIDIQRSCSNNELFGVNDHWSTLSIRNGHAKIKASGISALSCLSINISAESYYHRTWMYHQERDFSLMTDSLVLCVAKDKAILLTQTKIFWFSKDRKTAELTVSSEAGFRNLFNIGEDLYRLEGNSVSGIQKLTPGGIVKVKLQGDIVMQTNPSSLVVSVNHAAKQVFMSAGDNLFLVEPQADGSLRTRLILAGFDLKKNVITSACYDKENDIVFLGSKVAGFYVLKRKYFHSKTVVDTPTSYNLVPNVINEQIVFNDSSVLTDKGIIFSTGVGKAFFLSNVSSTMKFWGNRVMKGKNSVWFANGNLLYQYTIDLKALIDIRKLNFYASELAEVGDDLWIGTPRGEVYSLEHNKQKFPQLICKLEGNVQTIQPNGSYVWIGTDAGLFQIDRDKSTVKEIKELKGKTVRGLYFLNNEEMWICTYDAGFYLRKNGIIIHFPPDHNGHLNTAHCILEDNNGYLWISTNYGLFQTRKQDLLNYSNSNGTPPFYYYYDKDDGFLTNEFNGGNNRTGVKLPNGFFCFSSMNGWVFFNPRDVKARIPKQAMIIDKIEVGDVDLQANDSIAVPYDFDRLTITLATAYFGNSDNLLIEYKLDNGKWMIVKNDQVSFNAIPSGNHVLHVRKRSGFADEYKTKVIKIQVIPPWWETRVFTVCLVLVLAILLWLSFRIRFYLLKRKNKMLEEAVKVQTYKLNDYIAALENSEEKLRRENQFQERINKHIIHDIRTPLKYLTLSIKQLYKKMNGVDKHLEKQVLTIHDTSEQLFQFTGRFVNYLKGRTLAIQPKKEIYISELIEEKFKIFHLPARERGNTLINLVPQHQKVVAHALLLDILLHNLLDNCIKNTYDGTIKVEFGHDDQNYIIKVSDTGKGILIEDIQAYNDYLNNDKTQDNMSYTGLGFSIVKSVLPLIDGHITLMKNTPGGLIFVLKIGV